MTLNDGSPDETGMVPVLTPEARTAAERAIQQPFKSMNIFLMHRSREWHASPDWWACALCLIKFPGAGLRLGCNRPNDIVQRNGLFSTSGENIPVIHSYQAWFRQWFSPKRLPAARVSPALFRRRCEILLKEFCDASFGMTLFCYDAIHFTGPKWLPANLEVSSVTECRTRMEEFSHLELE